jgi:hypothetical protein
LISKIVPVSNPRLPPLDLDVSLHCETFVSLTDINDSISHILPGLQAPLNGGSEMNLVDNEYIQIRLFSAMWLKRPAVFWVHIVKKPIDSM